MVVASTAAVAQKTLDRPTFESSRHTLSKGQRIDVEETLTSGAEWATGSRLRWMAPAWSAGAVGSWTSSLHPRSCPPGSSCGETRSTPSGCSTRRASAPLSRWTPSPSSRLGRHSPGCWTVTSWTDRLRQLTSRTALSPRGTGSPVSWTCYSKGTRSRT